MKSYTIEIVTILMTTVVVRTEKYASSIAEVARPC